MKKAGVALRIVKDKCANIRVLDSLRLDTSNLLSQPLQKYLETERLRNLCPYSLLIELSPELRKNAVFGKTKVWNRKRKARSE